MNDLGTSSNLRRITTRNIIPNYGMYFNRQTTTSSIVPWMSGSNTLTVQFSSKAFAPTSSIEETILSVSTTSTDASQKILFKYADDSATNCGRYYFSTYSGSTLVTQNLNRNGWKYEGKNHASSSATTPWYIQGIFLTDDDTLLYTAHQNDNVSKCFEVNSTTWELQRSFIFPSPYKHISTIASASTYGWWFADWSTGRIINIDLEASFNTNTASIIQYYTITGSNLLSGLTFIDSASVTLLAYSEYKTTPTPRTHIFNPNIISNSGSYDISASIKYYKNPLRSQGILWKSGSRTMYENSSANSGQIFEYDIISFLDTGVNDDSHSVITSNLNVAPTNYPQGMAIDSNNRLWCGSESNLSYDDDVDSFSSLWSIYWKKTPIEENVYTTIWSNDIIDLRLNGRPFKIFTGSNIRNADTFNLGGRRDNSLPFSCGTIKNLYITSASLNTDQINLISLGTSSVFDTRSLNVIPFGVANPGAEDGLNDWVNESGSLGTRSLNPPPYNGTKYFTGGTSLFALGRQRLTLPSSSLWTTKTGSVILDWKQASFSISAGDKTGLGIILRNQATGSIDVKTSSIHPTRWQENAYGSQWEQRLFSVNTISGSHFVDILQQMSRSSGTNNDGYIDDISASIVYWNDDETFGV